MDMKKFFALALAALAALVSCQKESYSPEPQPQTQPKIVFELTASYSDNAPATKAVKTGRPSTCRCVTTVPPGLPWR